MEPTKDRITPEQFYSESKWPEMKDKFDKSAFLFHYYDLCQFANDYAQHYRNVIKLTTADKERLAETVIQKEIGIKPGTSLLTPMDYGECVRCIMTAVSAEHERAQQELQAYRDIIKELLPLAEKTFDSIARHEVIYAPNKLYKEEVAEIIDKARKLIE